MVSGPRPVARFEGRRVGTGTDLWRLWDQRRAGELSDDQWSELEAALTLGKGSCNTMGTASTMGGLCRKHSDWPGPVRRPFPPGTRRHLEIARRVGRRSVETEVRENSERRSK